MTRRPVAALLVCGLLACVGAATPAAAQSWDGDHQVRFGVFGHFGRVNGTATKLVTTEDYALSSRGLGASAGIEWVRPNAFAWGIEADVTATAGNDSATGNELSGNYLATLRLRAGLNLRPDLLWYATAGVAALGMETRFPAAEGGTKVSDTRAGYVVGTGIEWQRPGAIIFAEYLYSDYGTSSANNGTGVIQTYDADSHVVRLGVKFKVGHHHYHDDVAERIGRISK
jgi:hypothetical protein